MTGGRVHPSVISGYGLVEAPLEVTIGAFGTHQRAGQSRMSVVASSAAASEALDYLSVRTVPATRLALLDLDGWTGVLTNHRNGSDFNDHQYWAARTVGVRTVRVVDSDARWWRRGHLRERLSWEARIFQLHARDDAPLRVVTCVDDGGRWRFETSGDPLPIEASFNYTARRRKDRFTRGNLRDLLSELGPGPVSEERFWAVPRFALLAEWIIDDQWREQVEHWACSLQDADDPAFGYYLGGMSYTSHMATHATSVIHNLKRAIEINPSYEARARKYLDQARRVDRRRSQ